MKLLFVYGAKFKKDISGNLFTDGSINEEMWQRYADITDQLSIISILDNEQYDVEYAEKTFNSFDKSNKTLIPVPNLFSNISSFLDLEKRNILNKTIEKNVKENDFIIVRVPSVESYTAIKYAKKHKKPYLVEVVGCIWDALWNHSLKGKVLAPYYFKKMRSVVKESNYTVYVTNEFLQKRYPSNGEKTNCSNVSLVGFDERILTNRINKIKRIESDSRIILGTAAAVNVKYKGQQYIIESLGKLKQQGIGNFEYQLAGGGDQSFLKSVAEKYNVSEQVRFLGSIPHDKVFGWLDGIDVYVQPSKQEGLPRALIEAMSRAVPAFGARTAGIPELLESRFIFSNSRKNIDEICEILKTFDRITMLKQAQRNYQEAVKYDKEVIEERRRSFFMGFKNQIKSKEGSI